MVKLLVIDNKPIVVAVVRSRYRRNKRSYRSRRWKVLYYDEEGRFKTKYLHGWLDVLKYRLKVKRFKIRVCEYCGLKFRSNKKPEFCPRCHEAMS